MPDENSLITEAFEDFKLGRLDDAHQKLEGLAGDGSADSSALGLLGTIFYRKGDFERAAEYLNKAIEAEPVSPQFYNTLGMVYKGQGRFQEALDSIQQALALAPDYVKAYNNLGIIHLQRERFDRAIENFQKAISLQPDFVQAYNNLAVALHNTGDFSAAEKNCSEAISLKPDYAEAHNTLGSVLQVQGKAPEAIECYEKAVSLQQANAWFHLNLGIALLLDGRFQKGWREYQWRLAPGLTSYPYSFSVAQWAGQSFEGKTLLVHYEQGFGDTIQFVRYLPMVKKLGGKVIFEARGELVDLLRTVEGIDELIETGQTAHQETAFDLYVPLLSLPGIFRTELETIPSQVPYIRAKPAKARQWGEKLRDGDFKVGICWSGREVSVNKFFHLHRRRCPVEQFLALADIPGLKLYSLQKGWAAGELETSDAKTAIGDLSAEIGDFADTAAVIANLDLVISVDTAVLHLAGAMGTQSWALLSKACDWRWMRQREDCPWYPTMRLFRQKQEGDWDSVFKVLTPALREKVT